MSGIAYEPAKGLRSPRKAAFISQFLFPGVSGSSERNGGPPWASVTCENRVMAAAVTQRNEIVWCIAPALGEKVMDNASRPYSTHGAFHRTKNPLETAYRPFPVFANSHDHIIY